MEKTFFLWNQISSACEKFGFASFASALKSFGNSAFLGSEKAEE
jgi:hypothetical protein